MFMFRSVLVSLAGFAAIVATPLSMGADPDVVTVSHFSGKPVPRYESLRYSAVHGRQGPSLDHPILWRYERQGLPVLVVRETNGWRRVRDQDGDEVWVQARMLTELRTVLLVDDQLLRRQPSSESPARAKLTRGVVAELHGCQTLWCELIVDRRRGWVEKSALWGIETSSDGL